MHPAIDFRRVIPCIFLAYVYAVELLIDRNENWSDASLFSGLEIDKEKQRHAFFAVFIASEMKELCNRV